MLGRVAIKLSKILRLLLSLVVVEGDLGAVIVGVENQIRMQDFEIEGGSDLELGVEVLGQCEQILEKGNKALRKSPHCSA